MFPEVIIVLYQRMINILNGIPELPVKWKIMVSVLFTRQQDRTGIYFLFPSVHNK